MTALTKYGERWEEESQPEVKELLQQSRADLDSAAELKHLRPLSGAATPTSMGQITTLAAQLLEEAEEILWLRQPGLRFL